MHRDSMLLTLAACAAILWAGVNLPLMFDGWQTATVCLAALVIAFTALRAYLPERR